MNTAPIHLGILELSSDGTDAIPVCGRIVASGDNGTGKMMSVKSVTGWSLLDVGCTLLILNCSYIGHRL